MTLKTTAPAADKQAGHTDRKLAAACRSFEGFLVGEMLKMMHGRGPTTAGIIPTGRAESIFLRQQCEVLGQVLGDREPLGLARLIRQSVQRRANNEGRQQP